MTSRQVVAFREVRAGTQDDAARSRLTLALGLSVLFHAFLLSLQFGIPGLGLPGLELPWDERRAQTPQLQVRLAPVKHDSPPAVAPAPAPALVPAESPTAQSAVVPVAPPVFDQPAPGNIARSEAPPAALKLLPPPAPQLAAPQEPAQPSRTSAQTKRADVKIARRRHRRKPFHAKPRPPVIARSSRQDNFVVPSAPDEPDQQAAGIETTEPPAESQPMTDSIAIENAVDQQEADSVRQPEELAALLAAQQREEEALRHARQLEEQQQADEEARRLAMEQEANRQATQRREEEAILRAQQLEQQQQEEGRQRAQQLAAQQQEEEAARRLAMEQESRRLAEERAQRQQEEEALRHAQQLEVQRQAEETRQQLALEEQARRQAMERRQQEEALRHAQQLEAQQREREAAQRLAMEQQARQQAEALARQQAIQRQQEEAMRREQQLAAEESAQRARQLEAQRQAEVQAARAAQEQEARRQAEEAAAQAQRQQMAQQEAARNGAGTAARENAATIAAAQPRARESGNHAPMRPAPTSGNSGAPEESDDGPILLSEGDMASMQVQQVRKVDLTRLDTKEAKELTDTPQQARRRSIFGSVPDDIVLKMYIDGWRRAVERNGNRDDQVFAPGQLRGDSVVTVAVRSDGSVESVSVNRASGVPELDAAVRQIIQASERHDAFPPDLRRRYDAIEIRSVWRFDGQLRLVEDRH